MSRADRMFEIVQMLRRADRPVTAAMLAGHLEVALRTVYRDIAALQAQRVPVEGEAGIGYILRPGYDLPPLMFDAEELDAIATALSMLRRTPDPSLNEAAASALAKIVDVLPEGGAFDPEDPVMLTSRWHDVPPPAIDPEILRRAIRDETVLTLAYRDEQGEDTLRDIRPLALVYYIGSQVIAAWCELRADFRHFRIDRVLDCAPNGRTFRGEGHALRLRWREGHEIE